jgi:hypothetical protein
MHKDVYLELELKSPGSGELRRELDEERRRDPLPRSYFGGFVTTRSRRTQLPIDLEGETKLRVKFSVSNYGLRPPLKKVLAELQNFVTVEPDHAPTREEWKQLDGIEFKQFVERLVKNGAKMDAMELLRRRKGMTTTEAHNYVDALTASGSP